MKPKQQKFNLSTSSSWEKHFQIAKIPHDIEVGRYSKTIRTQDGTNRVFVIRDKEHRLENKHLAFLNKVKRYAATRTAWEPRKGAKQQGRFFTRAGFFENCIEVDLNSAYWEVAFRRGYISREIYEEGNAKAEDGSLLIPKKVRLIALGALAKSTQTLRYNVKTGRYDHLKFNRQPPNQYKKFFDVSLEVAHLLNEIGNRLQSSLFYWVDAIFFHNQMELIEVEEYFRQHELPYKIKQIKSIQVERTEYGYYQAISRFIQEGEEKNKEYKFASEEGKKYMIKKARKLVEKSI